MDEGKLQKQLTGGNSATRVTGPEGYRLDLYRLEHTRIS